MTTKSPAGVKYVSVGGPGAGRYTVIYKGVAIGTVSRFHMGAGQFGTSWTATTKSGKKSSRFTSRQQAASWLVKHASP